MATKGFKIGDIVVIDSPCHTVHNKIATITDTQGIFSKEIVYGVRVVGQEHNRLWFTARFLKMASEEFQVQPMNGRDGRIYYYPYRNTSGSMPHEKLEEALKEIPTMAKNLETPRQLKGSWIENAEDIKSIHEKGVEAHIDSVIEEHMSADLAFLRIKTPHPSLEEELAAIDKKYKAEIGAIRREHWIKKNQVLKRRKRWARKSKPQPKKASFFLRVACMAGLVGAAVSAVNYFLL